jgi:hypothetical protein
MLLRRNKAGWIEMMHYLTGVDWCDGPMSFHVDTKAEMENTIVYSQVHDLEGLSDRQIAIVEMKVRWGWTRLRYFLLLDAGTIEKKRKKKLGP